MSAIVDVDGPVLDGTLHYDPSSLAFATLPLRETFTSLLVNDVQLDVDDAGRITFVWGLCPHQSWVRRSLVPPTSMGGVLGVRGASLVPGVSVRVNKEERWPVAVDPDSGWVCLGDWSIKAARHVAFAPGAVASLVDGDLVALWLHPEPFPQASAG